MPQAMDMAQLTRRATATPDARTQRTSRDAEPKQRFDEVLDRKSRRADDAAQTDPSEPTKKADRAESKKSTRKSDKKADANDAPIEDTEQSADAEESSDAETNELPPVESEATVTADHPIVQEQKPDANADAEPVDDATAANAALAAATGTPTIDAQQAVVTDGAEALETIAAAAAAAEIDPTLPAATAAASTAQAKPVQSTPADATQADPDATPELGGAIELPDTGDADADTEGDAESDLANLVLRGKSADADDADLPKFEVDTPDVASVQPDAKPTPHVSTQPAHVAKEAAAPEQRFAADNVEKIITGVKSELTPNGGTMKIRLDPGNLGELQIDVTVDDGVLHASFQTTNDEATRLLSHSMQQLKTALETAGVSVDRIQVKQAAPSEQSSNQQSGEQDRQHQQHQQEHPERQEQERREALARMWRKLALGEEPLDLVA